MTRILLATRNLHKVVEIQSMLGGRFECVSLRDVAGAPEVVEDAGTFEGNALKKAETLAAWLRESGGAGNGDSDGIAFVLADDSGLEVDVLDGAPGVHSARFAAMDTGSAGNSGDAENNEKLLRLLADVPAGKRTARFRCVLALVPVVPGAALHGAQYFSGACEGRIGFERRGDHGFGYDPLFHPDGFDQTFAELGEDAKNRISHRSKALDGLKSGLARSG